jgi:Methane oxygenase PmoA
MQRVYFWLVAIGAACATVEATAAEGVAFAQQPGQVAITVDGRPLATYVYQDKVITRPYFAHVHVPSGLQVTRNHPPVEGKDLTDHATFHPGIWLAFGDISSQDYWRLQARVRHDRFVEEPKGSQQQGSFSVENSYCQADDPERVVCREICRYTVRKVQPGYLLVSDSVFRSDGKGFYFGDQEEMGLGVRVATPIAVKSGGHIVDAAGRVDEKQIWGKSATWCDYRGDMAGQRVGVLIMPDPANFRVARFHARDYGLLVANPFGQKVFGDAKESHVPVAAGDPFRLRFGVLLHSAPAGSESDCQAAFDDFTREVATLPRPEP